MLHPYHIPAVQRNATLSKWRFCVHADKRALLRDLTSDLSELNSVGDTLQRLASCIAEAVSAHSWSVYVLDPNDKGRIIRYVPDRENSREVAKDPDEAGNYVDDEDEELTLM